MIGSSSNDFTQVQGTLFKVPRIGSSGDATAFETRFTSSFLDSDKPPGSSDANPIRLGDEVTESDFASFIKVTYPLCVFRFDECSLQTITHRSHLSDRVKLSLSLPSTNGCPF